MSEKALHHIVKNLVAQYGAEIVGDHRLKGLLADELGESFKNEASFEQAYKMGVGKRLLALRQSRGDVSLKLDGIKQSFAERSLLERPISDYVVDCMAYGLGLVKSVREPSLAGTTIAMTRKITQLNEAIAHQVVEGRRAIFEGQRAISSARKIRMMGLLGAALSAVLLVCVVNVFLMDTGRIPKSPELKNQRLLEACAAGDAVYASELLRAGAYINIKNPQGESPMALAMRLDAAALVDSLNVFLKYDDVSMYDEAVAQGAMNVAAHYKGARDYALNTREVFSAVQNGDEKRVAELLASGVNVMAKDSLGEGLLFAAVRSDNFSLAKKFLAMGLDVNEKNLDGMKAYRVAKNKTARYLSDVANRDELFVFAVRNNKMDSARYFLDLGANKNYVDIKNRYTAAHYAVHYNNVKALETLQSWGVNLNVSTSQGTPAELALARNSLKAFRYLVKNVPSVSNQKLSNGETLLHRVIRDKRRASLVPLVLNAGASVYTADASGDLPIHAAARYGDSSLVKLFVDRGCDPKVENNAGEEVIKIAKRYDNTDVVHYLNQFYITGRIKEMYYGVREFIAGIFA